MPATSPPIDPQVLTELRAGEESALERVFRDQYPTLTAEAQAVLDDAALAALTVERTFVRVWRERQNFQTVEDLASFLRRTVHEAAVQKQSRRAVLHHFDTHSGAHAAHGPQRAGAKQPPAVDAAWAQVASSLHAAAPDAGKIAHEMADHSRHEAAEHIAAAAKGPPWKLILGFGGAVVALLIAAGWWLDRTSAEAAATSAIAASDAHVLSTAPGQQAQVTLTDGSKVVLGADSRLRVPSRFGDEVHALKLDGAATFTVAPGQKLPFDVRTDRATIVATGTVFSVRAYPTEDAVTVGVREGTVSVKTDKDTRTVTAGAALVAAKDGTLREPAAAAREEALGWADGYLIINGRPLRDVLPQFTRWYALTLYPKDPTLLNRVVTMRAKLGDKADAIAALESGAGLHFGYEGQTMVLSDTAGTQTTPKSAKAKNAKGR